MKFTIISGNDDRIFELNETSGDLITAKLLDYDEEPNSYKVGLTGLTTAPSFARLCKS